MNKLFKMILFCSILLFAVSNLQAQKYGITNKILDNGLDVIVINNPSVPLVTVELNVKNGVYTEQPEYDGLSHLYEHMFLKQILRFPTRKHTWKGFENLVQRLTELPAKKE